MDDLTFATYFNRVYIINLPSRPDRLQSIMRELDRLGFGPEQNRIFVPEAPMPSEPYGFPSLGVHGNFLSHLEILQDARAHESARTLILEDDAIFLRSLRSSTRQTSILHAVEEHDWGTWFPGHLLRGELAGQPKGIVQSTLPFTWAHCYAVHGRALGALTDFLEATLERPAGHPEGGKLYIDAALSLFRKNRTDYPSLISNPALSVQKGTTSNLAKWRGYDSWSLGHLAISQVRALRDEIWRWTGKDFRTTQDPDGLIADAARTERDGAPGTPS